ncbi:MAG: NUDIX hydrolase [Chloroflexi bacterium]|nr:MAG: NUDIX hydrolase [Chloroflexota bacterium]
MKVIRSRIVWEGSSWRLRVNTLAMPDGTEIEKGVVEHPGSVVLVPLQNERSQPQILMLSQYRLSLERTIQELPAGTRHWHETWLACAQRELQEETGFRAGVFVHLGNIWPAPGISNEIMRIYLAYDLLYDPLPQDADERIEVRPFPLETLLTLIKNGRLQDAKTIIALQKTADYLQNNPIPPAT